MGSPTPGQIMDMLLTSIAGNLELWDQFRQTVALNQLEAVLGNEGPPQYVVHHGEIGVIQSYYPNPSYDVQPPDLALPDSRTLLDQLEDPDLVRDMGLMIMVGQYEALLLSLLDDRFQETHPRPISYFFDGNRPTGYRLNSSQELTEAMLRSSEISDRFSPATISLLIGNLRPA